MGWIARSTWEIQLNLLEGEANKVPFPTLVFLDTLYSVLGFGGFKKTHLFPR